MIMSYLETNEQIDNSRKEVEIIKRKNQVEITELESKRTEIMSLDRFAMRVKIIEGIVSEPEDTATGFTSSKIKKEKKLKQLSCETITKDLTSGFQRTRERTIKKYLKK